MSPHGARLQRDAMYLMCLIALYGSLQTTILAFLRFLTTARMENSGSALDFSCPPVVQDFFCGILVFFCYCSEGLNFVQRS